MERRRVVGVVVIAFVASVLLARVDAATDTVLLLYTTDFHDHIRPGANGKGGLPYVSGYVKKVRAERPDLVLVDGGDVINKGDMLPSVTKGEIMYEAMKRIGYSAGVPGNHDFSRGLPQLLKNVSIAGFPILCVNAFKGDGSPVPLPRTCLVDADGVKVGIIGFTVHALGVPEAGCRVLKPDKTAAILAREAEKLDDQAHVIVAVGHYPGAKCKALAKKVTAVDVWVGGHSHQAVRRPMTVPGTRAVIVQAGSNAIFVGRLELTVDLDTEEIVSHRGRLVDLDHKTTPIDRNMARWIHEEESAKCPESREVLGKAAEDMPRHELGKLYARALRETAETDVALVNPRFLLDGFSTGQTIDRNAVFASHEMDRDKAVTTQLSGAQIRPFLEKARSLMVCPCWDGFVAKMNFRKPRGQRVVETDLDADRTYSVVLHADMLGGGKGRKGRKGGGPKQSGKPCAFTPTEALEAYIKGLTAKGLEVRRVK